MPPRKSLASAALASDTESETPRITRSRSTGTRSKSARSSSPSLMSPTPRKTRQTSPSRNAPGSPTKSPASPKKLASPTKGPSTPKAAPASPSRSAATSASPSTRSSAKGTSFIFSQLNKPRAIQLYLFCYNILSFVLWTGIMILMLGNIVMDPIWTSVDSASKGPNGCGPCCLFEMTTWHAVFKAFSKGFSVFGNLLGYVQALAVLEILHAALGWVNSRVLVVALQVGVRNFVIWAIVILFGTKSVQTHPSFVLMAFTWALSDMVRYAYYVCHLLWPNVPQFLTWCRYSLFLVLYPLGVGSEVMLINEFVNSYSPLSCCLKTLLVMLMFSYLPAFHVLYHHMIQQRSKNLTSGKRSESKRFMS